MKTKLSVTLDEAVVTFVDEQPGENRSEKIETIVRRYRSVQNDLLLREQLSKFGEAETDAEADAWRRAMEEAQWRESDAATSGRSRSPRSRGRGRRSS